MITVITVEWYDSVWRKYKKQKKATTRLKFGHRVKHANIRYSIILKIKGYK